MQIPTMTLHPMRKARQPIWRRPIPMRSPPIQTRSRRRTPGRGISTKRFANRRASRTRPVVIASLLWTMILLAVPAQAAPSIADVRQAMIGTWQSTDDTRFPRELDADGTAIDHYEGATETLKGTWLVFDGNAPPPDVKGRALMPNAIYLELKQSDDTLFFGLTALIGQMLKMVYLERGSALSFDRIK
jgi:hypothetical protein